MNKIFLLKAISSLAVIAFLHSCSTGTPHNAATPLTVSQVSGPNAYETLLDKYVTPQGVRYQEWTSSPADLTKLEAVTGYYASHQPPTGSEAALAWYLNAYNAWILHRILSNWPNEGPLNVSFLFFHKKSIVVSGEKMSFLHLENEIIRKKFPEPRLHFALNCASRSCPPLHTKPFVASNLDRVLEELTVTFLNENPNALSETESEVQLSKIFKWYEEDFGGRENLVAFINRYRKQPLSLTKKVSFLDYDWQLNSAL